MKHLTLILAMASFVFATNTHALESEKEKLSYAMGYFFAKNVTQQDIDLDTDSFIAAVQDILDGKETKLSEQQVQEVLTKYQAEEQQKRTNSATANLEAGNKFLAENKNKEGVQQSESGLQYKILKEGDGEKPSANSVVTAHYKGSLIDGTVFDSSYERGEPASFPLDRVIKGWQEALPMMKTGSKWQIYVPANLGYGERGAGGTIGPNSTLIFDIELISFK